MKTNFPQLLFALSLAMSVAILSAPTGRAEETVAQDPAQVLVSNTWCWTHGAPGAEAQWSTTLTFHADGTASNVTDARIWHWWLTDPRTVHLQFETPNGAAPALDAGSGMNLTFDPGMKEFDGLPAVASAGIVARGFRQPSGGEVVLASAAENPALQPDSLARFHEELPTVAQWVFGPLEEEVPAAAWARIARFEAELRGEGARVSLDHFEGYRAGLEICARLRAELMERREWLHRWNRQGELPEAWRKAWAERVASVRPGIEHSFGTVREYVHERPYLAKVAAAAHAASHAPDAERESHVPTAHAAPHVAAHHSRAEHRKKEKERR